MYIEIVSFVLPSSASAGNTQTQQYWVAVLGNVVGNYNMMDGDNNLFYLIAYVR